MKNSYFTFFTVLFLLPCLTQAGWIDQNSGIINELWSVHFPADAQTGYAVGDYGTVLKTTDGGANWLDQTWNSDLFFTTVHFPADTQTGYAVGWNCIIYKTINGGLNWTSQWPSTHNDRYAAWWSVHFPVDDQTGYVVGTGFNVLKTTDGGITWVYQNVSFGEVFSVHFPVDTDTGYIVGQGGAIAKTTDGGGTFIEEEKSYDPDWQVKSLRVLPNPFVCSACVPGYEQEYFVLWDISGTRVGIYQGNCIGTDLASGIYFLRPVNSSEKPIQIIKLR